MNYDVVLVFPDHSVGLVFSGASVVSADTLPDGYDVEIVASQVLFVTPFGNYRVGDPIAVGKTILSISRPADLPFYVVQIATGGVAPGGGAFDFSDPSNLIFLASI